MGSQGVLTLFTADPPANDDDHVAFFELLGRQVGAALRNARLYEQVRRGRRRLAALSRRLIMADEDQRRHIARELHDEIGQSLTALKLNLQAGAAADDPTAREALAGEGRQIIDRLIMQVRELSLDLRPSLLDDLGLVAALRSYVNRLSQRAGLAVRFDASGPEGRLEPDLETACFRVAQEALTNVVRHAHALHVEVGLRQDLGALELFVRDDGIGFDPVEARAAPPPASASGCSACRSASPWSAAASSSARSPAGAPRSAPASPSPGRPPARSGVLDDADSRPAGR